MTESPEDATRRHYSGGLGTMPKRSMGFGELDELDQQIESLGKTVAILDERLSSVSRPAGPLAREKNRPPEEPLPDFIARIRVARVKLSQLEDTVRDIRDRVLI